MAAGKGGKRFDADGNEASDVVSHASDSDIQRELTGFDRMARQVGGASVRKQTIVNAVIFCLVIATFVASTWIPKGSLAWLPVDLKWLALDIGVALISVKLAYFFHNTLKLNHYMFWAHVSMDHRLLDIKRKLEDLSDEVEKLKGGAADNDPA